MFNFKIFLDQNINALIGSDYHVEKDHFLNLATVAQGEEWKNQRPEMPTFDLTLASGSIRCIHKVSYFTWYLTLCRI